jgi:hypothetical protein
MKVIVRNGRLSFNDLFEPKSFKDSEPSFGVTLICSDDTELLIDSDEVDSKTGKPIKKRLKHGMLQKIIEKVLAEKAGGKLPAKYKNWTYNKADGSTTRDQYIDQKTGDYWAGFDENTWYVSAKKRADKVPGGKLKVLDQEKNPIEANSGKIFSGCYVSCIIQVYAMKDEKAGWTVQASLEAVQLLKKGEPLGFKQIDAESEFDEEKMEASDLDAAEVDDML